MKKRYQNIIKNSNGNIWKKLLKYYEKSNGNIWKNNYKSIIKKK